jgi:hypothetical protein
MDNHDRDREVPIRLPADGAPLDRVTASNSGTDRRLLDPRVDSNRGPLAMGYLHGIDEGYYRHWPGLEGSSLESSHAGQVFDRR